MAGLSEGYVIPRLANVCVTPPLVCDVPDGEGGVQQGRGAHAELHLSDDKDNGYESLGGTSQTFSDYLPVVPYNEDNTVNEEFVLPSKQDVLRELTDDDIAQVAPRDDDEWTQLIRDKLVLEKQNER